MTSVVMIELGCANTASVRWAFERLGATVELTTAPKRIETAQRLVLPGVGAAGFAMQRIHDLGLFDLLKGFSRPLLGVCLGQQLLFERSEEGQIPCLGLLKGEVRALTPYESLVVPHMGWNRLNPLKAHGLVKTIKASDYAYFVHSYVCPVTEDTLLETTYGQGFAAAVGRDNLMGCQFHPERSSETGATILRNFLSL